jgi:hypothetical protein
MMRAVLPGNWLNDGVDYTFVESRSSNEANGSTAG